MFPKTIVFPVATLADYRRVIRCRNLRPLLTGGLGGVGLPRRVAMFYGDRPSAVPGGVISLSDGTRCVLVHHDGCLKAVTGREGAVTVVWRTDRPPECAIGLDDGLIVMPAEGPARRFAALRDADGQLSWNEIPLFPSLPPLMIVRRDVGTAVSTLPVMTLRSSYTTTSQQLGDTDRAAIDKAMREAYIALSDSALSRGRYIQPVVARYRLRGEGGRVLYTSAPVIVAPRTGLQGVTATLTLTGEGFRQCGETRLSATEFVPAIEYTRTPDAEWKALVRSVELLVSPQLHPLSAKLPGHTRKSGASATQLTMTATLAGVDPLRGYAAEGTRPAAYVAAILDNADSALLSGRPADDTLGELSRLSAIMDMSSASPTAESTLAVSVGAPHRFTASAVARSGDLIAWGGLRVMPFDGYSLPEMSIEAPAAQTSLPTAVRVTMHDGSSVVRTAVMSGFGEPSLSPLLVYPSADAVEMTLIAGGKALTVPLVSTPCGRMSYRLSPDLRPTSLTEDRGGYVVPSASPRCREYPSAVAVCGVASPLEPVTVSYGDGMKLCALLPAMRHSNSFAVPSARFYLFGSGGISSMTLTDNRRRINLNLLDSRGVSSPMAVTPMVGGVAAIAGGALVTVTGSRPVTLLDNCRATMLGWSDRYGELWCIGAGDDSDDEALVTSPDGSVLYTRGGIGIDGVVSGSAGMVLVGSDGRLLDPSEEEDGPVSVSHVSAVGHCYAPGSCAMLHAGVSGEGLTGRIVLTASHDSSGRASAAVRTLVVSGGDLSHPLCEPVAVPHSHRMTLEVSLSTSCPSKFVITEP